MTIETAADPKNLLEVVADIAFTAGHMAAKGEMTVNDSRSLVQDICDWSRQFEEAFVHDKHGDDYMELVDGYAAFRLQGNHTEAEALLQQMRS